MSLSETMKPHLNKLHGFNFKDWSSDSSNVVLTDNDKDFALFEKEGEGIYSSHLFCSEKRGKDAIEFGKWAVKEMFEKHNAIVLKGLTPLDNRPALFVARKIGFKPYAVVDTIVGPAQQFVLIKEECNE